MAILLGLLVAATYGAADFLGGLSSKRASVPAVVVLSQLFGVPLLVALLVAAPGTPSAHDLTLGAAAGAFGGFGLVSLYRGLAVGRMSVVAPVTAVGAAVVPVAWGLAAGERPSALSSIGVALALVAVVLVSRTPEPAPGHPSADGAPVAAGKVLPLAALAGVAFGMVFVLLSLTGSDAGFWPLVASRATSIVLLGLGAAATGRSFAVASRRVTATIIGAGALDISANAIFLLASRRGLLTIVAALSSLYPASTVLLARIVLRERLVAAQIAGLALACTGVVLIAA